MWASATFRGQPAAAFLQTAPLSSVAIGDTNGVRLMAAVVFRVRYEQPPVFNGFSGLRIYGQEVPELGNDNDYYDVGTTLRSRLRRLFGRRTSGYSFRGHHQRFWVMGFRRCCCTTNRLNPAVSAWPQIAG